MSEFLQVNWADLRRRVPRLGRGQQRACPDYGIGLGTLRDAHRD